MEWTRGPLIGRGSSATVSTATSTSGDLFAVKSAPLSQSENLQKEQHFLSLLNSPYILTYKGHDITHENNTMFYNIHMQYMPGGSISGAGKSRRLTKPEIKRYTRDIVRGLEYLHSRKIVHCDIKGGNILIDEKGARIGDLGCAKWVGEVAPVSGTPVFMSPEVVRGGEQGFPADVWALGCTVIEMVTGGLPWGNVDDPVSVLYKIGFSGELPEIPDGFSGDGRDFVGKCLVRDPEQRWTAKQLLEHPFVVEFDDNLEEVICEKTSADSPTSVLDRDVWSLIGESVVLSPVGTEKKCSSDSLRHRVEQLVGKSEMAKELEKHPFDEHLAEMICEKTSRDSPTSVLDQDVWSSIEESLSLSLSPVGTEKLCSSDSSRHRIEQLVGRSEKAKWGWETEESGWIVVRGNEDGDGKGEVGRRWVR